MTILLRDIPLYIKNKIRLLIDEWAYWSKWAHWCRRIRVHKRVTKILGTQYKPDHKRIEIDITYRCDLSCSQCNRLCNHNNILDEDRMTVEQIQRFVDESISQSRKWEWIHVAGGEPTMHPDILKILDILLIYKKQYSPKTRVMLLTNGAGETSAKIQSLLGEGVEVVDSNKSSPGRVNHSIITYAPCDLEENADVDFSNGCRIPSWCGIGLSPSGYYQCNPAAAFDRIMGFNIGYKTLPKSNDQMYHHFEKFCKYCGAFGWFYAKKKDKMNMTRTWKNFFENYKKSPPTLTRY